MKYTNHSGGCPGADMAWETEGRKYNVHTIAYSFYNHVQKSNNQHVLTLDELNEGFDRVRYAATLLKRPVDHLMPYVKNLLARNWFQVKNANAVFAVGTFQTNKKIVNGGTGWSVQMAVDTQKPIFFFDQKSRMWHTYIADVQLFDVCDVPTLTEHFAGIGTRELDEYGLAAIEEIYQTNFPTI